MIIVCGCEVRVSWEFVMVIPHSSLSAEHSNLFVERANRAKKRETKRKVTQDVAEGNTTKERKRPHLDVEEMTVHDGGEIIEETVKCTGMPNLGFATL